MERSLPYRPLVDVFLGLASARAHLHAPVQREVCERELSDGRILVYIQAKNGQANAQTRGVTVCGYKEMRRGKLGISKVSIRPVPSAEQPALRLELIRELTPSLDYVHWH